MIRGCGVEADFFTKLPPQEKTLALDTPDAGEQRAQAERMRNFRPDTVLALRELSYRRRDRSGTVLQVIYGLELADLQSKRTVWKAQVTFTPGLGADAPTMLTHEIRDRLTADGILRPCAGAKS